MGSVLGGVSSLSVDVEAVDADAGDGFATIELLGPGAAVLATFDCAGASTCAATQDIAVVAATYVVARATELDGDQLAAAPIWASP
jgi:hypothetical protein